MSAADFTINGVANPNRHTTTHGATVTLALASVTGVQSIAWAVASKAPAALSSPTITPAGTPSGATATFTFPADPGGDTGATLRISCTVTTATGTVVTYGIVGVPSSGGFLPVCPDEEFERSSTQGWADEINGIAAVHPLRRKATVQTTNATVTTLDSATLAAGTVSMVRATVLARSTADICNGYDLYAVVDQTGGTAALVGSAFGTAREEAAGWDATIDCDAATVRIRITGAAATTINWRANWSIETYAP